MSITVQDKKGNILVNETLKAREKQKNCIHDWIKVGAVYECPKCLSTK